MWLIAGLGNPGPGYAMHRHNIGFRVVDELAGRIGAKFSAPARLRSQIAEGRLGPIGPDAPRVALLKSRTFMNDTGTAVSKAIKYYKINSEQLIVIHDELDLDLGRMRVKFGGGDNGHNGLKSIRKSLSGADYYRVRVGIGRPPGRQEPADFLLSNFSTRERDSVELEVTRAADAVESLINSGLERTQSTFNG
jgi:PTH1 family peptidyl-tRNA hydrolase